MFFTKMHGLGNDFIIFENIKAKDYDWQEIARKVCDRHTGVGADGIILVEESDVADVKMQIINSDGSIAEMCGNGIRCFSKYVYENSIVNKENFNVETLAGIMKCENKIESGLVSSVRINMGSPICNRDNIPFTGPSNNMDYTIRVKDKILNAATIVQGVPHTVIYVDEIKDDFITEFGRIIENHMYFPQKTNVNFVKILGKDSIEIKTWERGAGLTLACGTGTCASVVCSYKNGLVTNKVKAKLEKGELLIEYIGDEVFMDGPAEFICTGKLLF